MNMDNHLTDDQIVRYLVDPVDLPSGFIIHMETCLHCQSEKNSLESKLCRLGEIARSSAPEIRKRIILPHIQTEKSHSMSWVRSPAVGATFAVGVLLAVWLGFSHMEQQNKVAKLTTEMIRDEYLMTEIEKLDRNDLPQTWIDISSDSEVDLDDSLIEILTPGS